MKAAIIWILVSALIFIGMGLAVYGLSVPLPLNSALGYVIGGFFVSYLSLPILKFSGV